MGSVSGASKLTVSRLQYIDMVHKLGEPSIVELTDLLTIRRCASSRLTSLRGDAGFTNSASARNLSRGKSFPWRGSPGQLLGVSAGDEIGSHPLGREIRRENGAERSARSIAACLEQESVA